MRAAHLTAFAISIACAPGCGDGGSKPKGSTSASSADADESATASASAEKPTTAHQQTFRDPKLAGPAYVVTSDQVLIVEPDGSTDVVFETPGIVQLEQLATGDLLVGSSTGLHRIRGRTSKPIVASLPAMTTEVTSSGDDDAWAMSKRAVHHFDGASWVATPLPGLKGETKLRDMAVDVRGVAWLAAGADGLFEWDGSRWKKHDGVKGEVIDVAPSPLGVFALLPTGYVEVDKGTARELMKPGNAGVISGDIATDGSWAIVTGEGDMRSFSIGKGSDQVWSDLVSKLGSDASWFAVDNRGRVWATTKRFLTIASKAEPNVVVPLSAAITGELIAVEVVGAGPDKLPTEIGPSVSMPLPEASIPLPSGSAKQGSVAINAEPGFADGAVSNASMVIAGMSAGFRRCYNRGLLENPNMKGSLRITAKIGPNGEVLSASPSGGSGISQTVVSCIAARVASAQFGKPTGGGATLVIPVTLMPQ